MRIDSRTLAVEHDERDTRVELRLRQEQQRCGGIAATMLRERLYIASANGTKTLGETLVSRAR